MIWDGRWEGGSGLGTHVHPWLIHVNVWQNQYSIVKQNEVKIKIKKKMKVLDAQLCPTLCNPMVCPWNFIGKNTGVGCHSLPQGIFPLLYAKNYGVTGR